MFTRWFYFRVSNCRNEELAVNIVNAGKASFPFAFSGYNVTASYDKSHWFRWGRTGQRSWAACRMGW